MIRRSDRQPTTLPKLDADDPRKGSNMTTHRIDHPYRLCSTVARYLYRRNIATDAPTATRRARAAIRARRDGGKYLSRMAGNIIRRAVQHRRARSGRVEAR